MSVDVADDNCSRMNNLDKTVSVVNNEVKNGVTLPRMCQQDLSRNDHYPGNLYYGHA